MRVYKSIISMTVLTQTVLSIILAIPLQATPVENDLQYSKIKAASKGIDRCSLKAHLCIAGAKVSSELNMKKKALHLEHKAENHVKLMKTHAEALSRAIGVTRNDETTEHGKIVNHAIDQGMKKLNTYHSKVENAKIKHIPRIPGKVQSYNNMIVKVNHQ